MEYNAPDVPPILSSTMAAMARIPATAFDSGREFDLRAEMMALEPATNVSPQSPSPATCQIRKKLLIPIVSYFVISGSALMRALVAPRKMMLNSSGSADTCATFSCPSSGGEGIKSNLPALFQALTLPFHPVAVVLSSKALCTSAGSLNLDKLSSVNETPGPFNAVIKVPTYTLVGLIPYVDSS